MQALIIDAISSRKCLTIHYDPGERLIEPHAIGFTRDRNLVVRAYQVEGVSASGAEVMLPGTIP